MEKELQLILKRTNKGRTDNYTYGKLYINREFICDTLEDKDRGLHDGMSIDEIKEKKVYGSTAIPYGKYLVNMNTISPKFKNRQWARPYKGVIPRLELVKGFEGVLIHVGNKIQDTLGCILVGTYIGNGTLVRSTDAYKKLMNILLDHKNDLITIKIE